MKQLEAIETSNTMYRVMERASVGLTSGFTSTLKVFRRSNLASRLDSLSILTEQSILSLYQSLQLSKPCKSPFV